MIPVLGLHTIGRVLCPPYGVLCIQHSVSCARGSITAKPLTPRTGFGRGSGGWGESHPERHYA